jgi:RimJ/RimL family protein N-acetyltransferase
MPPNAGLGSRSPRRGSLWRKTELVRWDPPDPPLTKNAIALRPFRTGDASDVAAACTDPDIVRFTFMQDGLSIDGARAWIDRGNEAWPQGNPRYAIVDALDDRVLGQVGMAVDDHSRAEAFYWVTPRARQRGVASSALGLLADWAFENGVERLYLLVHPENEASSRVAARLGFTREGVLRSYEPFKGGRPDLVSWSLLRRDPRPWHR